MKSSCLYILRLYAKTHLRWDIDFNIFRSIIILRKSRVMPHLLRCQGLAVPEYSFALAALDLRHPRLLQH
jgi:hypothetical protein